VDHAQAGIFSMRPRGRLGFAVLTAVVVVAAGITLDGTTPHARPGLPARSPASGAWFCPHGGGDGWRTDLYVANPGDAPVEIRVTALATRRSEAPSTYTVQPGAELRFEAPSSDEAASSYIEYFGGWVAAGWVTRAGGAQTGVAAEPCAPEPGTRWFAADGSTEQGQSAAIVVMNPFDSDAVVDVTVLSEHRAPIRQSSFTNVRIVAHHSALLRLNSVSADEPAAAAEVLAHAGRVAVSSLGVSGDGGIRGVVGVTEPSDEVLLSGTGDVGQSTLAVTVPGADEVRFGATLLSDGKPEVAGGLTASSQGGQSSRAYPLITAGSSVVDVRVEAGSSPVVAVRRSVGVNGDPGATGGTPGPAAAWIVTPTVGGSPNAPGMVLGNPGGTPVEVELTLMGAEGAAGRTSVTVPPESAIGVPRGFLGGDPTAAVLAVASEGTFVATGASSSLGREGVADYAVASGLPVPAYAAVGP
jgi:hypothetical protein